MFSQVENKEMLKPKLILYFLICQCLGARFIVVAAIHCIKAPLKQRSRERFEKFTSDGWNIERYL